MTAFATTVDVPDLLGTSPADLIDQAATHPAADHATARSRADRIRAGLVSYHQMRQDIADAYAAHDWTALGYPTWYAYIDREFGTQLQQLAHRRDDRKSAVADLRGQGLSTRQIAAVAGVDAKTVRNDLDGRPAPATVTGSDGKTYPATRPAADPTPAATPDSPAGSPAQLTPQAGGDPQDRPGTQLPAGRDPQKSTAVSGEAASAAVATTGQPGAPADVVHYGPRELFAGGACYRQTRHDTPAGAQLTGDPRKVTCQACLDVDLDESTCEECGADVPADKPLALCDSCETDAVTPGGPTTVELPPLAVVADGGALVYDYGTVTSGSRDVRIRAGRLADDDVPVVWLAVEADGVETELLALSPLKVELLITRLQAAHRFTLTAEVPS
jgi:hypothetical protein